MRVLLAIDGSSFSTAAVEEVAQRPWPVGAEIRIISVAQPPLVARPETWELPVDFAEQMEKAVLDRAQPVVDIAAQRLREALGARIKTSAAVLLGHPKQAIIDEAERWRADLVVVGSHGQSALTRFLLGSVSQTVASHARCSVEIVRDRKTSHRWKRRAGFSER